jgi:ribulose-phosphate 3-epimerase
MSLNNPNRYLISTISDNPRDIFSNLEKFDAHNFGGLHFDVMDGVFVPRLGLYPELLWEIRKSTSMFIEVHTMLQNPIPYFHVLAESGADRIVVHVETVMDLGLILKELDSLGIEKGLALNPRTSIDSLIPYIESIDSVMLMAINPGVPRHPLIESTFSKIEKVRALIQERNPKIKIGIDGGVTFSNQLKLLSLGADYLICGSGTVFHPNNSLSENIEQLLNN